MMMKSLRQFNVSLMRSIGVRQFLFSRRAYGKSVQTPLVESLRRRILTTGPLTVADYMRECLTNPHHGYYMKKDVFGTKGDFITSPEISQMFGELLGVWIASEWQSLGSNNHLHIIEFGPGRGTLASDILRVLTQFDGIKERISLHLIDVSPKMREIQRKTLCSATADGSTSHQKSVYGNVDITWHHSLADVDIHGNCCVIAHEFLDALPIHKFQKNEKGVFHEVLIDVADSSSPHHFREVLAPTPNANSTKLVNPKDERDHVEVSPLAGMFVQDIASHINKHGGFALLADYGHNGEKEDTFRGFQSHKLVNTLEQPGEIDLTADVDFSFLRHCLSPFKVVTHGPIPQQVFLHNMGISIRLKTLLNAAKTEQQRLDLLTSYKMLCSPDEMGDRFKFFMIHPHGHSSLPAAATS